MKINNALRNLLLLLALLAFPAITTAQSPELFSYQAVVRDAANEPMVNTPVAVIFTIHATTPGGAIVYTETHNTTTNSYGLITLRIGEGATSDDLGTLTWSDGYFFLNTNVNGDDMGTTQMVTVPYALYSDEAGNVFSGIYDDLTGKPDVTNWNTAYGWGDHGSAGYDEDETNELQDLNLTTNTLGLSGSTATVDLSPYLDSQWGHYADSIFFDVGNVGIGTNTPGSPLTVAGKLDNNQPIFEVINTNGDAVFSIYNDGSVDIRIMEDMFAKGPKGGFSIGGFSPTKGLAYQYATISPDSTMFFFRENEAKGPKGGFSIGGFDAYKGESEKYLEVRGGRSLGTGNNTFIGLDAGGDLGYESTSNTVIGTNAGYNLTSGASNNIIIGDSAGYKTTHGDDNVFIGRNSGAEMWNGYNNVYIGYRTGSEGHGQYNVFIGNEAGRYNEGGFGNTFMGNGAGKNITTGDMNILIGTQAGQNLNDGNENVIMGFGAGASSEDSDKNIFIGTSAGYFNSGGESNIYLGYQAGLINEGSNNILIGMNAGPNTGSNNILLGPSIGSGQTDLNYTLAIDRLGSVDMTDSFIYGDMFADKLQLNASTGIKTAPEVGYDLTVDGSISCFALLETSDARLKTNIQTIVNPLSKVLNLRGVTFNWNKEGVSQDKTSIGFLAQEAIEVIPEVVSKGSEFYSISYAPITALLVEAIKELKSENDKLKAEMNKIDQLQKQIDELKLLIGKE